MYLTVMMLVAGVVAIVVSVAEAGIHLPDKESRIDPAEVRTTAPFDNPGVFETGDGAFDAVIVAQAWSWTPAEITVPVGAEVEFVLTSTDVIHGIMIWDTNVNAMVVPGQVTRVTATFDEAGEYPMVCHEYCGIGHHAMFGKVVVTE